MYSGIYILVIWAKHFQTPNNDKNMYPVPNNDLLCTNHEKYQATKMPLSLKMGI